MGGVGGLEGIKSTEGKGVYGQHGDSQTVGTKSETSEGKETPQ